MNKIKHRIYLIIVICIAILFLNAKSCYATRSKLQSRIDDYEKNGNTGILTTETMDGSSTIWDENQNFFCISKGKGNSNNSSSAKYQITSFFKISKDGIEYMIWQPGEYGLRKWSWKVIKEDFNAETITKKMYYVLSQDSSKYGSHYNTGYDANGFQIISQKQYAIWPIIDEFLEKYGDRSNEWNDMNSNNQEDITDCELYNEMNRNAQKLHEDDRDMKKPVYIWLYQTSDKTIRYGEKTFWQNLILAGQEGDSSGGGRRPVAGGGGGSRWSVYLVVLSLKL